VTQNGNLRVITLPGVYEALLRDAQGLPWGRVALTVTRTAFSGSLTTTVDAKAFTVKGNLAVDIPGAAGSASVTIPVRGGQPYQLDLRVTDRLDVTARRNGVQVAVVSGPLDGAKLASYSSRSRAPWAGAYSLILADPRGLTPSSDVRPLGAGHAVTSVDAAGVIKMKGSLSDGTPFTGAFKTDAVGAYRVFALPYGASRVGSYFAGVVDLDPHPEKAGRFYVSASRGLDVYWAKSARPQDKSYAAGFGPLGLNATLDPWQVPDRTTTLASLLGVPSGSFAQSLGAPAEDLFTLRGGPASLRFTTGTRILADATNTASWTGTVTPATGAFKGSYKLIDTVVVSGRSRQVTRVVNFSGMLRQGPTNDAGIFGRGYFSQPALQGTALASGDLRFGAQATGVTSGVVKDGLTGAPVAGVGLRFETLDGVLLAQTTTDAQGNYSQVLGAGSRRVIVSLAGYVSTTLFITVTSNQTIEADVVLFAPLRTGQGTISGRVVNAFNADGVARAQVRLRAGVNATSGTVLRTVTTSADGSFSFQVNGGAYTAEAVATSFTSGYANLVAVGGSTLSNQDVRVTPQLALNELRVVLTWGGQPSDLDSHLAGPSTAGGIFHVYYSNRSAPGSQANLDVDDTDSFGPETITLSTRSAGTYRYWVHDYSNSGETGSTALSQFSSAKVIVYRGLGSGTVKVAEFNVPTGRVGTAWVVFDFDGATGVITPRNLLLNIAGSASIP
jgi:hypothetical protein